MKTYRIENSKHEAYRIRPMNDDVDWLAISPTLDCFTVYDEDSGDDIQVFPSSDSDVEFEVVQEDDGTIAILLRGSVVFSDEDAQRIDSATNGVDYAVDLESSDGDDLEADEDYEFVENYNVLLSAL
jgi:hypothetical protein